MDLDKPIAIALFALSLYGCGPDARTQVDRVRRGHADIVHSAATVHAGRTRFECLRSASGACHYIVRRPGCIASTALRALPRCAPLHAFIVAEHAARDVDGLQRFDVCIGDDARAAAVCSSARSPVMMR
jgi:hypothetical protein